MTGFNSVLLDVDSTVCGIEGIDWLAERKGAGIVERVRNLTASAMEGRTPLGEIYETRLALVAPSRNDIDELSKEYLRTIAPDAATAVGEFLRRGIDVHLISAGFLSPVTAVAQKLGIAPENTHAVAVYFDDHGEYLSFDRESPLTRENGKRDVASSLNLRRPSLMAGDGISDAEARPAVDAFAAFTGFVRREAVVSRADYVTESFDQLLTLVSR